jgi:hypothetical protein
VTNRSPFPLLAIVLYAACTGDPGQLTPETVVELPAIFQEHRIYLRPVTQGGDTLVFYTDTGGGLSRLYAPVALRLNLPQQRVALGGDTVTVTDWPMWSAGAAIPPDDTSGPLGARVLVAPFEGELAILQDAGDAGFLGRRWFAGRVWTFDYRAGRLLLRPPGNLPPHDPEQRVPLGFQTDATGLRTMHFPRIRVAVAGDSLDLLFDTGATMVLTDSALSIMGDGRPARRATSFISAAVFDGWRVDHPEWRVIERATSVGADLIELPEIEVASHRVGPVWFERRSAGTFEDWMSRMMDRQIVGALGGDALRFFRVTVDYPNAVAIFERR